ncbi:MAG: hypothetical protein NTX28_03690 [Novosphingobium sp.]|nr:hypothetical protein [Novosphingobium sp.]
MRVSERQRRVATIAIVVALSVVSFLALDRLTSEVRYAQVRTALHALPGWRLGMALGFTGLSYLALTFYDHIALRVIGRPLPWRTAALASFSSYTLSHNLGFGLLTGSSARYRIYVAAGLDGPDVVRVVALAGATFWAGVGLVGALAMVLGHGALHLGAITLGGATLQAIGIVTLVAIGAIVALVVARRQPLAVLGTTLPLPAARAIAIKDKHTFKAEFDDEAKKAMFRHMHEKVA